MDTNNAAAKQALPSQSLSPDKFSDTGFFNLFKIIDHAHLVVQPVSLVQAVQVFARILFTLETILRLFFLKHFARFDFASDAGNGFAAIVSPASGAIVVLP